MRIFLSSVISGMETYRAAAQRAAETLGHTVTMAEDFGASPFSPQQVCLGAVRDADIVMLLLGRGEHLGTWRLSRVLRYT